MPCSKVSLEASSFWNGVIVARHCSMLPLVMTTRSSSTPSRPSSLRASNSHTTLVPMSWHTSVARCTPSTASSPCIASACAKSE
jgi:hypothetical protein